MGRSKSPTQPQVGFVMPPSASAPHYPSYPAQQHYQQPQPQPHYYPNQPFPAPIQQQPGQYYAQSGGAAAAGMPLWSNRNFQSYLQNATSFHVKQKVEMVEAILGWETGNQYTVKDQSGNKVFYVGEESNICGRQLCNSRRAFTLTAKDVTGQNVLVMDRPLDCSCCFGFGCPDKMTVSTPQGQLLGCVVEEFNILYPNFSIRDAADNTVLRMDGPMCPVAFGTCTGPIVFRLTNLAGVSVGTISKEWSGFVRELFTDADYFSISFPHDLDPSIKAVCMGALFLIDYEYFESGATDKHQGGRRLFG